MKALKNEMRINVPPIAIVIACAAAVLISFVIVFVRAGHDISGHEFLNNAEKAHAICTGKSIYTTENDRGENVLHYVVGVKFQAMGLDYVTTIDETTQSLENIDVGSKFNIYYNKDDPNVCRSYYSFEQVAVMPYILCGLVIVIASIFGYRNIKTIMRNRTPYVSKLEKNVDPDNEGTYTDGSTQPGADNGLSDTAIDYAAADPFSTNPMDSTIDPFAVYTGYDENSPDNQQPYGYDPNAGYVPPEEIPQPPDQGFDINSPYASYQDDPFRPQ